MLGKLCVILGGCRTQDAQGPLLLLQNFYEWAPEMDQLPAGAKGSLLPCNRICPKIHRSRSLSFCISPRSMINYVLEEVGPMAFL